MPRKILRKQWHIIEYILNLIEFISSTFTNSSMNKIKKVSDQTNLVIINLEEISRFSA